MSTHPGFDLPRTSGLALGRQQTTSTLNPLLHVRDQAPSGAGTTPSVALTFNIRTINTVVTNTIKGTGLAANRVTLPAGVYDVNARAPGYRCGRFCLYVYSVTQAAYVLLGGNGHQGTSDTGMSDVSIFGRLVLDTQNELELRQYSEFANAAGLGFAISSGQPEVYLDALFRKIA